jgi:hypothetical protein
MPSPEQDAPNGDGRPEHFQSRELHELPQERSDHISDIARMLSNVYRLKIVDILNKAGSSSAEKLRTLLPEIPHIAMDSALKTLKDAGWVRTALIAWEDVYFLTPDAQNIARSFIGTYVKSEPEKHASVRELQITLNISPPANVPPGRI